MDKIYDGVEYTKDGKKVRPSMFQNGKLTNEQKKKGSLKGRIPYWSQELRCYFYLKPGVDFKEIEQLYIENRKNLNKLTK